MGEKDKNYDVQWKNMSLYKDFNDSPFLFPHLMSSCLLCGGISHQRKQSTIFVGLQREFDSISASGFCVHLN